MSELVVKVARAICGAGSDPDEMVAGSPMWTGWEAESRAAIAAVIEFLYLEAGRSVCPGAAAEYLSAKFLEKQINE